MASRVIHLAVAHELAASLGITDTERFYFGHVLPDMVMGDYDVRLLLKKLTHFYTLLPNGRKTYDFIRFGDEYKDRLDDPLYLGYYVHLIEDDIFRKYLYYKVGLLYRRGEKALLDEIYADYHLLNPLLVKKYGIVLPTVPEGIESEPVYTCFDYSVSEWLEDMKGDLTEAPEGELMHFTKELIFEFIDECRDVISRELAALGQGEHFLTLDVYSIENYNSTKDRR